MSEKYRFTRANVDETAEKVYQFIVKYITKNTYSPSVRDICRGVGIKSTSTIHNHLNRLQDDGRITYSDGKRRAIVVPELELKNDIRQAPLIGKVTAGSPILAVENIERNIPIPDYFDRYPNMYALEVKGDSMIDAAIMDGDIVFVDKQNSANSGDIVVALIEDEATVKTFKIIDNKPFLIPQNTAYRPIPFDHEGCSILGIVRGVLRVSV
ncbi:MAG TPA: transcriptional repressor LexA [Clostridiaceae bacterium]|nr:transcriptional repressor LexA [Clostridiaceae bacterium]